jgi:hypothetical protein
MGERIWSPTRGPRLILARVARCGVENAGKPAEARPHRLHEAHAAVLVARGPDQGEALDLPVHQPGVGGRMDALVLPLDHEGLVRALARALLGHDLERLHDLVKAGEPALVARLGDQDHLRRSPSRASKRTKGGSTTGSPRTPSGSRSGCPPPRRARSGGPGPQDRVVGAQKLGPLAGGENARRLVAALRLPGGQLAAAGARARKRRRLPPW